MIKTASTSGIPTPSTAPATQEYRAPVAPCPAHTPVLITESEVLFGTAAAVRSPARRSVVGVMSGSLRSVAAQWRNLTARRPYYPARLSYLEDSLMAREMDRL